VLTSHVPVAGELTGLTHEGASSVVVTDREARSEVPDSGKVAVKRVGNVMKVDDAVTKELFEEHVTDPPS